MENFRYLISVVIPTHNRSCYAVACVQSLLEIKSDKLQIVVHDTSNDGCELAAWAANQKDPRLCYVHWRDRLSMTENHERALALAEGEYVCLIGDDDSVSARIVEVAEYAKAQGINLLTPTVKAVYSWPDFRTRLYGMAHAGKVYLNDFSGALSSCDTLKSLEAALSRACQGTDGLPKLYHGLVRRSLLDVLRERYGQVFFGTSPDVSAAVALSLEGNHHHVIDLPFTLPGASAGSNTGRSALNKHKGDIEKDPHMQPFKNLAWPKELPRFFSVETVWAHAAWETLHGIGRVDLIEHFNLARLYALCLLYHRDYRAFTLEAWRAAQRNGYQNVSNVAVVKELLGVVFGLVASKSKRLLRPSASNGREVLGVVNDVRLARLALDKRIADHIVFFRVLGKER
ncbi:MAG: glycosyltransferase family 2 protein [Gammaproteobacteria bacterium]